MSGRRKISSYLPARVYEKHGSWWFVDREHKWHKLCRQDEGVARLYECLAAFTRAADTSARALNTMPALIDDWMQKELPRYAPRTKQNYVLMLKLIRSEFDSEWLIDDVRPVDVARFLDKHFYDKPNTSNKYKALLSSLFTHAVRKGLRDRNPSREIRGAPESKRDRYITDEELKAIRAAVVAGASRKASSARSVLCLIDLAYQTAQRISDLLALNWQDVSDDGIFFHPSKTVNSTSVKLLIEMTADLQSTIDNARCGKVVGIGPVICTNKGGRFTYIGAYSAWKRARQRARKTYERDCDRRGVPPDPMFLVGIHFHDLRAKALTDQKRLYGADAAQSLAGHMTAQMTAHYTKAREVERVRPVPLRHAS
ncbi:tyrosine-type recombinase/integrase [Paraburkholderia sp. 22B1P]|uniref:tyrosine-type recombinase/integrase n=1 Tax=Paraburkholderia sp. 22B1P TaxID=3080498 RepID=UPI00308A7154|nr:tyrosine-type recombinase/integrase [Paraburkholderia sp. 22B1P]